MEEHKIHEKCIILLAVVVHVGCELNQKLSKYCEIHLTFECHHEMFMECVHITFSTIKFKYFPSTRGQHDAKMWKSQNLRFS